MNVKKPNLFYNRPDDAENIRKLDDPLGEVPSGAGDAASSNQNRDNLVARIVKENADAAAARVAADR